MPEYDTRAEWDFILVDHAFGSTCSIEPEPCHYTQPFLGEQMEGRRLTGGLVIQEAVARSRFQAPILLSSAVLCQILTKQLSPGPAIGQKDFDCVLLSTNSLDLCTLEFWGKRK